MAFKELAFTLEEYEQQLKFLDQDFKYLSTDQMFQIASPMILSTAFKRKLRRDEQLYELYKNDMGLIAHLKNPPRYQDYVNPWKAIKGFDVRDVIHTITQPTLIMVGSKDKGNLIDSEWMHGKIKNSTFEVLEGIGHGFIIEAPEKTNDIMWNFLKPHLS